MFGPQAIDPEIAAEYPPIPRLIRSYLNINSKLEILVYQFLNVFEKAFEIAGIGTTLVSTIVLKDYVSDIKEAREEAAQRLKKEKEK